ncbi:UDP-glycosyltransferase 92A1-like [Castanea sativa]|uniref:UDP-glycosyltransferase 92A1-like n=1 Tax=Castanea sativa TaxID=21020 RepID=UPI003F652ABE
MDSREHIVMLPFMAHGHLIPFLALARQIQQRTGFIITIATTKLNIQYLCSSISTDSNSQPLSNIRFAELPFNTTDHDLPPNTENTEYLSPSSIGNFLHASLSLKDPLLQLLNDIVHQEGKPPLCVISDELFGWATELAKSVGTVNIAFTTTGAYGTLAYVSIWLNLPHRYSTDSEEFKVPGFPESYRFHRSQLNPYVRDADGTDIWSRYLQTQLSQSIESFGWLCNSVEEIEPLGFDLLRKYLGVPVWSIGPLIPLAALKNTSSSTSGFSFFKQLTGKKPGLTPEKCIEWLDLHGPDSVVYISFGSQNSIGLAQMMELAIGLEDSGVSFIWVIRPPIGFDLKSEFKAEWLPEGFEERMKQSKRGLLVRNWAPQLDILSHKSTGAFLSHCGWNSVLESLSQGVPILGWPMATEQAYNSKMLMEEMGVSVELTRGSQGIIVGKEVKRVIVLVLDKEGKGKDMRNKAVEVEKQLREAVRDETDDMGSSVKAIDDFVRSILSRNQEQAESIGVQKFM